ncbi:hypothetical protein NQ318_006102 [Aromia moschata]|uniref:Uncharacterized protein n=1 Tax=Aromia moschata TaxID=1265417 RepID=A0AAV8Z248_9CUCU|nr:hypothetical protein NQ318_006102 [Aromia moschata]
MVLRIVDKNPQWLSFSTQEIDERLGFFQNHFALTGDEVRLITIKAPKLITFPIHKIKLNSFVLKEEMGFSQEEIKQIIISKPSMLYRDQNKILKTFEFLHKTMNIPLEKILRTPEILTCRHKRLMERHLFLEKMERAQYDSRKPNYVALTTLVAGSDSHFSTEIAKSSIQIYNAFLKSL